MNRIKILHLFLLALILSGCTSLPKDNGLSDVHDLLNERGVETTVPDSDKLDEFINSLVTELISLDDATQLALINNTDLHKSYANLGIAAADVYEAGRISNPIFSFSQLDSNQSGERDKITLGFVASLSDLITLSSRKSLAESQFAAMKQSIAADVLRILNEVQAAFYEYAAALQIQSLKQQQFKTAMLSSQLAERYRRAGNISDREELEEKAKTSNAMFESFEANAIALAARTELANLLGLTIEENWQINAELQIPSNTEIDITSLKATATQSRMDLLAAQLEAERLAKQLGITNWTRYLGDLDVGFERERETDGAKLKGPTVEWEVPIFNQHYDENIRVVSEFKMAMLEVKKLSTEIQNEVHANYLKTKDARALVHEYQHNFIPNQSAIVSRAQEEENFMLIGTFELLDTKQEEYESYVGLIEALQNYWIAYANLMYAAGDSLSLPSSTKNDVFNIEDHLTSSPSNGHDAHAHH